MSRHVDEGWGSCLPRFFSNLLLTSPLASLSRIFIAWLGTNTASPTRTILATATTNQSTVSTRVRLRWWMAYISWPGIRRESSAIGGCRIPITTNIRAVLRVQGVWGLTAAGLWYWANVRSMIDDRFRVRWCTTHHSQLRQWWGHHGRVQRGEGEWAALIVHVRFCRLQEFQCCILLEMSGLFVLPSRSLGTLTSAHLNITLASSLPPKSIMQLLVLY